MRLFALLLITALAIPFGTGAQSIMPGAGGEDLTITLSPMYPRPYDTVTISVSSNLVNLAASDLDIAVNGTVINEGNRSVTARMGRPGTRTTIRATAVSGTTTYQRQITVIPADVALILEPVSTSHPFYQGASLVSSEGRVRIIALPDLRTSAGTRIAASELSYTWRIGEQILAAQSGIGKSVFVATAPVRYRDANVSVTVTTRDQSLTARASIAVSPVDPIVRIYRTDPLSGPIFTKALTGTYALSQAEETLRAVAYYFKAPPALAWSLNGNLSGGEDRLTVRSSGGSGTGVVSLTATDEKAQARTNITLQFQAPERNGIFGL